MIPVTITAQVYTIGNQQYLVEGDLWHQLSYRTAAEVLKVALQTDADLTVIKTIVDSPCFIPVTCEGKTFLVFTSTRQFPIQWWEEVSPETLETLTALQVEGIVLDLVRDIKAVAS